jgi:hypothetical protein
MEETVHNTLTNKDGKFIWLRVKVGKWNINYCMLQTIISILSQTAD